MKKMILAVAVLLCFTAMSCKKNSLVSEEEYAMQKSGQVAGPDGLKPCYCPAVYKPVCGSNGVTYSNACEARCNGITVYTPGACGGGDLNGSIGGYNDCIGRPLKNVYCLDVYQPVCGCDGNTYSNGCYASVAGIKSYTQGACGDDGTMKPVKK